MPVNEKRVKDYIDYYSFYEKPDGEECFQKTFYYTKYAGITGAVLSVYEAVLVSKPRTVFSTIARIGHFTFPCAGMGFFFGSTLCLMAHLRKKDGVMNHVVAGMSAGTVWGMKYGKVSVGHRWGIFLGLLAGYWKFLKLNNLPIFQQRPSCSDEYHPILDWSVKMYEDPGRPSTAY